MFFFMFIVYSLVGLVAGYSAYQFIGLETGLAVAVGAITTAVLAQIHLIARSSKTEAELEERLTSVEKTSRDVDERMTVVEARADVVETTVKHELTHRRDALVNEMQQLEGLIERLSKTFEARLNENNAQPAAPAEDDAILKDVKSALRDGRVDLHLQPIVSLPQRRVSFYEGFSRLRRQDGSLILPADFLDAARRASLMGIIDNFTLFRCVQIVRRLAERDRRVGVFCNISASSLEDDTFFSLFYDFMDENRDLAKSIIFELRADRFNKRSSKMTQNMEKLTGLGFRFSIDHVTSLELELQQFQQAGVRFVKIKGTTLIEQLKDPAGPRPRSSLNRPIGGDEVAAVFSRYGITVIGEKMEEESSVVEILELDIPFGQGHVFGVPRPIKASLMEETAPPEHIVERLAALG